MNSQSYESITFEVEPGLKKPENGYRSVYVNPNFTEEQLQHPSEVSLDKYPFDYIIENHTLDEFVEGAETVLRDIGLLN